jgi:hypothetical protein
MSPEHFVSWDVRVNIDWILCSWNVMKSIANSESSCDFSALSFINSPTRCSNSAFSCLQCLNPTSAFLFSFSLIFFTQINYIKFGLQLNIDLIQMFKLILKILHLLYNHHFSFLLLQRLALIQTFKCLDSFGEVGVLFFGGLDLSTHLGQFLAHFL